MWQHTGTRGSLGRGPRRHRCARSRSGAPSKPAAGEDESWVGEKTGKNDDSAAKEAAAVEPSPANGKAVAETRTMDVIRKLVMDNRKAARKCYDDARKDQKDLTGDVVIHFVLDPEWQGEAGRAEPRALHLEGAGRGGLRAGRDPRHSLPQVVPGMETSTNYPFNFTP